VNDDPSTWDRMPKYCILLRLTHPKAIEKPFNINKDGFGIGAAWITVPTIQSIRHEA
jgi:hypothetical protein